ncbi:hypothetical protein E2320_002400 [Naja naja]|nr:hypothetical protein E2320_002400 [Naja naja]
MPDLPQQIPSNTLLAKWINTVLEAARETQKREVGRKSGGQKEINNIRDKRYLSTKFLQLGQSCKKLGPKYTGPFAITWIINLVTVELGPQSPMEKVFNGLYSRAI